MITWETIALLATSPLWVPMVIIVVVLGATLISLFVLGIALAVVSLLDGFRK